MKRRPVTADEIDFVTKNYPAMSMHEIADRIGRTLEGTRQIWKKYGTPKRREPKLTPEQIARIKETYSDRVTCDIASELGCTVWQIREIARKHGLAKKPGFASVTGKRGAHHPRAVATRFTKGLQPWNKGKKVGQTEAQKAHCWQKGHVPHNAVPVGTEVVKAHGYVECKIAEPNVWRLKHHLIWEEHNGPVPDGHVIRFRDGNNQNFSIENLELVTREEHMVQNSILNLPGEYQDIYRQIGGLRRRINNAKKQADRSAGSPV